MKSTASQRQQIYKLCNYDSELKASLVVQITGDENLSSTTHLTVGQAGNLIKILCTNWAAFDIKNAQHKYILSLLRQAGWTVEHETRGTIADLSRFSSWLKSMRSPVQKPLMNMTKEETSKIINALEHVVKWEHNKNQ